MSVRALAQRRHLERDDVEPVVEVLAEPALRDLLGEVAVRRRDHADVDLDRLRAADALELVLLQEAQQLDLDRRRDLADLVEEQRAAVGEREPAVLARHRAGERAALVTEQLALEQRLGERRAVQLDERAVRARRPLVDRVGDELLAGAALAGDQHGRRLGAT